MNKTQQTSAANTSEYENNPFLVATKGLELLFTHAKSVGILFAVIAAVGFIGNGVQTAFQPGETHTGSMPAHHAMANIPPAFILTFALIFLALLVVAFVIGIVIRGIGDYTAAQLANNKVVGLSQAFKEVFDNFWPYTWLVILQSVKLFLWTLLLIIPGIVMSYRYSLSGVAFFDKQLSGNRAIKESLRVTDGAFISVFASQSLFNVVTFGAIASILQPGTNAVLYRQLAPIPSATDKPKPSVLSILTLVGIVSFILLFILFIAAVIAFLAAR